MPPLVDFIVWILSLALAAAGIFAFIDAARRPKAAFDYIGKLNKPLWLALLAIATVFVFIAPVNIIGLAGIVGIGVYYADMRPKLKELT